MNGTEDRKTVKVQKLKKIMNKESCVKMAGVKGLEPSASCVTGRRSNQLSYIPRKWRWVYLYCLTSHPARFDGA